jgi:hypothetical protein
MKTPLHILHLEDDPKDAAPVRSTLEAAGIACSTTLVQDQVGFVGALELDTGTAHLGEIAKGNATESVSPAVL